MEIRVLKAEAGHLSHFRALFDEYVQGLDVCTDPEVTTKLFELPYFHGFIACADEEPAGFAVCFESFSSYRAKRVLNIHDFMVSERFRGCGVGKALLDGIEGFCREHDFLKITLEVDEDNHAARKLYAACDFGDYRVVLKGLLHWQKYL